MTDRYPPGFLVSVVFKDGSSLNANVRVLRYEAGMAVVLPDGLPPDLAFRVPADRLRAPRIRKTARSKEMA